MKNFSIKIILLILLFPLQAFSQTSLEELSLKMGEFNVGFKHFISIDSSRSYQRIYDWTDEYIPRPIPISIWYPAKTVSSDQMEVLDYMRILKEEEEWEYLPDTFILNWFYYSNTPENQKHLSEKVKAISNAEVYDGKFPVIIYAPSFQASSIENFALCELLASHGYVVISSPSRGPKNRNFARNSIENAETQARDIQYLINLANGLPYADANSVAAMGFSYGGLSAVLAYSYNKQISTIVSLDGSIKYQYPTIEQSPFFDVKEFDIPFVHFSQKDIPMQVMVEDGIDTTLNNQFEFFDLLTNSNAYHFKFNNLTHSYFSTLGVLFEQRDPRQDKTDLEIMQSYRLMTDYTLQSLNAFLLGNSDSRIWLNNGPSANGTQGDITVKVEIKDPDPKEISFQDFNRMAAEKEYQKLDELYRSILAEKSDFEIPEGLLNNLGLQLSFNKETTEKGLLVFQFAVSLYPSSSNLYDSMGEAYLYAGDKSKSIQSFEKSLSLDPTNENARKRIAELSR